MRLNNLPYLKKWRKDLRNNMTRAEVILWIQLRNRQLNSRKFRRQHSIENYIVDFYCAEERLVIEVDGGIHNDSNVIEKDIKRDARLKELGFRVYRVTNEDVYNHLAAVLEEIKQEFEPLEVPKRTPVVPLEIRRTGFPVL